MTPLKLLALDRDDLEIISAHLQDAVMRVGDMAYLPSKNQFATVLNRFDWEETLGKGGGKGKYQRRRTGLHFDRVQGVQVQNIRQSAKDAIVELLAIEFKEIEAPGGCITMIFAGGGAVRLDVECIEVQMKDLGPAWETTNLPDHSTET